MSDALQTLTDEELAALAAQSVDAQAVLLARYLRLIRFHAGRFAAAPADVDDLVQEGLIVLMRAVRQYDPSQGSAFSAYAQTCIVNRMRSFLRRERRAAEPAGDVTQLLAGEPVDPDTPESILVEKENYDSRRMQVMALLSDREWQILQCVMLGASYEQTAQTLHINVKSVDNAMQRIRRKMRAVRSTGEHG